MIFSNSCKYAIKSCIYLAKKNTKTDVTEISEYIGSPASFTSKILQKLVRKGVISSSKGRQGGFYLSEEQMKNITVKDIFYAIENSHILEECALGIAECGEKTPCPIHHLVKDIKYQIRNILEMKIKDMKDEGTIS